VRRGASSMVGRAGSANNGLRPIGVGMPHGRSEQGRPVTDWWVRGHSDGWRGSNGLNRCRIQIVQKQSNISKLGPIKKLLSLTQKKLR
jgi:hypothetical protein